MQGDKKREEKKQNKKEREEKQERGKRHQAEKKNKKGKRENRGEEGEGDQKGTTEKIKASRDCLSVFAPFSASKICRIGENKVHEPVEREGRRCKKQETGANTEQKEKG